MKIGISCEEFHQDELSNLLGTNFYKYAIKTNGGILLNPQKLCLGLVPKICKGIDVYENTKIEKFDIDQGTSAYTNEGFKIQAKKIIVAINPGCQN